MYKKVVLFLSMIFLVIPLTFAIGTERYPNPSGVDFDYQNEGRGSFTTVAGQFDFDLFAKGLTASLGTPIIDDLDNNSVSELIIIDSDIAKVFQGKELTAISSIDIGDAPADISNVISFDIDGDGMNEIIFIAVNLNATNDRVVILNFTQSDGIQIQNVFTINAEVTHPMIGCRAANECIGVITSGSTNDLFNPFNAVHRGITFDSTGLTLPTTFIIYTEAQATGDEIALCSPRDKNIVVNDYDSDGNIEYIISMGKQENSGGNDVEYRVFWLDNTTVIQTGFESNTVSNIITECPNEFGITNSFTSPLVAEVFSSEPQKEAFIGAASDPTDFKIFAFRGSDAFQFEEFPEILEADGIIISNVILGNFFPETGAVDVCVLGYDNTVPEIDLLCGTETRGFLLPDSDSFEFDTTGLFNISNSIIELDLLSHGVQFSNAPTGFQDLNEIINPYGIFTLDFVGVNELLRIFQNTAGDSVILAVDLERVGADDIIAMTETNIFYFDDKLSNEPAVIVDITFNPCVIDSFLKVNTTLSIITEVRDTNDAILGFDPINLEVIVYEDTTDERNQTFTNVSVSQVTGATTIPSEFIVNVTGISQRIVLRASDTENPTEIDEVIQIFSVAELGLEFGDSICTLEIEVTAEEEEAALNISVAATANEGLTNFFEGASNEFKVSPLVIVLFLMLGFTFAVLTTADRANDSMITMNKIVFLFVGNAIIFILGALVGAIPFGALLVIIIFGIFGIILWASRMFNNSTA